MITETDIKSLPAEIRIELELLEKLKPFLAVCMKLNHDLNNPLAGVIGYTEFVLAEPAQMTPDQIDLLNKVLICAEKIKEQLEDLCRIKSGLGDPNEVENLIKQFLSTSGK